MGEIAIYFGDTKIAEVESYSASRNPLGRLWALKLERVYPICTAALSDAFLSGQMEVQVKRRRLHGYVDYHHCRVSAFCEMENGAYPMIWMNSAYRVEEM